MKQIFYLFFNIFALLEFLLVTQIRVRIPKVIFTNICFRYFETPFKDVKLLDDGQIFEIFNYGLKLAVVVNFEKNIHLFQLNLRLLLRSISYVQISK